MFVLGFVDDINVSLGSNSIGGNCDILKISQSVELLKEFVDDDDGEGCSVNWNKNDMNQWIGECVYDEEVEEDQYFIILEVDQI